MIKRLVLSGGGPNGISQLAVIKYLCDQKILDLREIKSVYGTSVGTLLGLFVILEYNLTTISDFFIKRPWEKVLPLEFENMMEIIQNNGYIDNSFVADVIDMLLSAIEVPSTITFKELYDKTDKLFNVYTVDVDKFTTTIFSHESHPDLSVKHAILMSCALPPIFKPLEYNNEFYMDGGIFCDYPINDCLDRFPNKKETLGIRITREGNTVKYADTISMPNYMLFCIIKLISYTQKQHTIQDIYDIKINAKCNTIDPVLWQNFLKESERKEMFELGIQSAKQFITTQNLEIPQESQCLV